MMPQRVRVGRDVRLVARHVDGVELEGRPRLRPGQPIDVVGVDDPCSLRARRANVWTWLVVDVGSGGPVFRGFCRWDLPTRE